MAPGNSGGEGKVRGRAERAERTERTAEQLETTLVGAQPPRANSQPWAISQLSRLSALA